MDLNAALADARNALEAAQREAAAADARVEALKTEVTGLELAVSRHGGHGELRLAPPPEPARAFEQNGESWLGMPRTRAVERVLREHGDPMSPTEVTETLQANGRSDQTTDVSAAIAYLKRKGLATAVGRAQWTATKLELGTKSGGA